MDFIGSPRIRLGEIAECPALQSRVPVASRDTHASEIDKYQENRELTPFAMLYVEKMINEGLRSMDEGNGSYKPYAAQNSKPAVVQTETPEPVGRRHLFPLLRWDGERFRFELSPENLMAHSGFSWRMQ